MTYELFLLVSTYVNSFGTALTVFTRISTSALTYIQVLEDMQFLRQTYRKFW